MHEDNEQSTLVSMRLVIILLSCSSLQISFMICISMQSNKLLYLVNLSLWKCWTEISCISQLPFEPPSYQIISIRAYFCFMTTMMFCTFWNIMKIGQFRESLHSIKVKWKKLETRHKELQGIHFSGKTFTKTKTFRYFSLA